MNAHIVTAGKLENGAFMLDQIPALTTASLAEVAADSSSDCIVDKVYRGRPLVISFNYFTQLDTYDFFGRLKKIEALIGMPLNRVFLRDRQHCWYQRGVAGMGDSVSEVANHLRLLVERIGPSSVITLGQSMGGYAAVLFGLLLHADRTVAFGPLSNLKSAQAIADDDQRWLPIFQMLEADPPEAWCDDLVGFAMAQVVRPVLHIVTGTNPVGLHGEANRDIVHLQRFSRIPGACTYEYPEAWHEVVQWLIERGLIDEILYRLVMGASPPEPENCEKFPALDAA